jgi:curved DNA-binding protein CbpA
MLHPTWDSMPIPGYATMRRTLFEGCRRAMTDFYELLQISPNADSETIHRVYRFLAARVHPDHMKDGDSGIFLQLKTAYDVLSDPARRAAYDAARQPEAEKPLSTSVDFMDNRDGELNRRLAVLALLYHRRRAMPHLPEVALAEIEERMGFPRDYLDFTLWYLQKKGYLVKADNAQYALTAEGVDFVESERAKLPILNRLLTSSTGSSYPQNASTYQQPDSVRGEQIRGALNEPAPNSRTVVQRSYQGRQTEQQNGKEERRIGAPDLRRIKIERRKNLGERAGSAADRRPLN